MADEKQKTEAKHEEKKTEQKKKNYAFANGRSLRMSAKTAAHILDMIRYKTIDDAIKTMEEIASGKKPVRMHNREVGHRKGAGIMAGRYPKNAAKEIMPVLKQLKSNAIYNGMEVEEAVLALCKIDKASKPYKRGGARAKRAHISLKAEIKKRTESKKEKLENKKTEGEKKK